jgi:CIC family chloride channel protein
VEDVLKKAINNPSGENMTVQDLMQASPDVVFITDSMKSVLAKMENVWLLPVINEREEFVGFVSKTAVFNKYRALLSREKSYWGGAPGEK